MKNTSLANLIESCCNDVTLSFCGDTVTISSDKYLYSRIYSKYDIIATDAHGRFFSKLISLTQWNDYEKILDYFIECARPIIDEISRDAISVDCYYLDKDTIWNMCESQGYFVEIYNSIQSLQDQFYAISEQYGSNVANREVLKENRPRFSAVTLSNSFMDAIKNQAKVELANAATGLVFDIVNSSANKKDKNAAVEKLNSVFDGHKTSFGASAGIAYKRFFLILITMLKGKYPNIEMSDFDVNAARTIHNNIKDLNLPLNKQYDLARQVIQNVPYDPNYYSDFYIRFNEHRSEVCNAAALFGVDISLTVFLEVSKHLNANLNDSIESIKSCIAYFEREAINCHLSDKYTQDLFNIINDYFIKNMTIQIKRKVAIYYATYETTKACRNFLNEIINKYDEALNSLRENNIVNVPSNNYQKLYNIIDERNRELLCQEVTAMLDDTSESLGKAEDYIMSIAEQQGFSYDIRSSAKELISKHRETCAQRFIDENLGTTEEDAINCLEKFNEYADSIKLAFNYRNNCTIKINNRISQLDREYRTIAGVTLSSKEQADEIRDTMNNYPAVFDNEYSFKTRDEIINAATVLKEIKIPERLEKVYSDILDEKLKKFDKSYAENLINNPPKMVFHRDYEDYIAKLQELTEDERAIDQAYIYEIKLRQFEADCNKASNYEKNIAKKTWWFDWGEFAIYLIIGIVLAAIAIAIISFCKYEQIGALFIMPITHLIAIPIVIAFAIYLEYSISEDAKLTWEKLTSNGKYKFQEIACVKNPNRKKTEMPKFENGETSFSQIGQVVKLPDNSKDAAITKDTKVNSNTVARIKKGEYVGIISLTDKIFYHVKYYSNTGVYYGYILKKYLEIQNVETKKISNKL